MEIGSITIDSKPSLFILILSCLIFTFFLGIFIIHLGIVVYFHYVSQPEKWIRNLIQPNLKHKQGGDRLNKPHCFFRNIQSFFIKNQIFNYIYCDFSNMTTKRFMHFFQNVTLVLTSVVLAVCYKNIVTYNCQIESYSVFRFGQNSLLFLYALAVISDNIKTKPKHKIKYEGYENKDLFWKPFGNFLRKISNHFKHSQNIFITVNLGHDAIREIDILRIIAKNIRTEYLAFRKSFRKNYIWMTFVLFVTYTLTLGLYHHHASKTLENTVKKELQIEYYLPTQHENILQLEGNSMGVDDIVDAIDSIYKKENKDKHYFDFVFVFNSINDSLNQNNGWKTIADSIAPEQKTKDSLATDPLYEMVDLYYKGLSRLENKYPDLSRDSVNKTTTPSEALFINYYSKPK